MKKNKKIVCLLKGVLALTFLSGSQDLFAQECPGGSSYCSQCGSCVESGAGCPPETRAFEGTETTTLYVLPKGTYFACHVDKDSAPDTSATPKTYKSPVDHFRCSNVHTKEKSLTVKVYESEVGKVHRLPSALHYQCEEGAPMKIVGSCYGMQMYRCGDSKGDEKIKNKKK